MNIVQIKYFISVVEHGSITAAARDQFISLQGMSQAIADLEAELGIPLLERQNRGSVPTKFGIEFYQEARPFLFQYESLERFVHDRVGSSAGTEKLNVYLCTPSYSSTERSSLRTATYLNERFEMNAIIHFGSKTLCFEALANKAADAVMIIGNISDVPMPYTCEILCHLPCVAQMSQRNPLSGKTTLRFAELDGTPLALWPDFDFFNETVEALLETEHGITDIGSSTRAIDEQIAFFDKGGAFIIPHLGGLDSDYLRTKPVPFHDGENMQVPLCLIKRKETLETNA